MEMQLSSAAQRQEDEKDRRLAAERQESTKQSQALTRLQWQLEMEKKQQESLEKTLKVRIPAVVEHAACAVPHAHL